MSDQDKEVNEISEGGEHLRFYVGHGIRERRLDKYLHGRFGNLSRTTIQKLIREEGVTVNNNAVKPSFKLSPHDEVDLILPPPEIKEIIAEDIPLDVVYEDEAIIVINKQADLIVHPARGNTHGTLVNALAYYAGELSTAGGDFRPGIVHRLDRNTTGVMVVAKTDTAHWRISHQFEQRKVSKTYLAIVHGVPELDADRISMPLGVHPKVREKYAIRPEIGREAITFYEVVERFRGYCLLKITPKTGRTHQIRVHLSYIKHPIVGDDMYGGKEVYRWQLEDREAKAEEPLIGRCALHAQQIEFNHPETGRRMSFEAPLPADMQNLLEELRRHRIA
ncbi:MAG: RluA family pseudouridine synthase [Planctomycetota bacterium]